MAGYVFAVSKDSWNSLCNENLKYGHFSPYTPEIRDEHLETGKERSRKSINKVLAAVFGDMVTMRPGDNIYFLSDRKIYGVGELIEIGGDCKYDNYIDASALLPDCTIELNDVLTSNSTRARWSCFFIPAPYFFTKGADMDDVLRYRPNAFKMLRAFEGVTFIKIDEEENTALKEFISLINESAYASIDTTTFSFSTDKHDELRTKNLASHKMNIFKALTHPDNRDYVLSEMFIEASLLQSLSQRSDTVFGSWDYLTHQLIASPFKPLSYIDKMDVYGFRTSIHYPGTPKLITKFLLVELKYGKINAAAVEQTMQYVDWICSEYASGDYSRIVAYAVGLDAVRNIDSIVSTKCKRDYITESHPVKTATWNDFHVVGYKINDTDITFEEL